MKQLTRAVASRLGLNAEMRLEFAEVVENGSVMSNGLFSILFRALVTEMPYEVAKGTRKDPEIWIKSWMRENVAAV